MTSGTVKPPDATAEQYVEGRGYGMIMFAAVLLLVSACLNLIYGIAAIANSHVFVANAHYVVGALRAWGWATLILAILLFLAAGRGAGGQPAGALVRGGGASAERYRADALHSRLPGLVADDLCRGRGRDLRAVRPRQPPEPGRIAPERAKYRVGLRAPDSRGAPGTSPTGVILRSHHDSGDHPHRPRPCRPHPRQSAAITDQATSGTAHGKRD